MLHAVKPYFEADGFILYHGDSLKLLRDVPDESIDLCFADPPYFLSNGGVTVQSGKMVSVNKAAWDVSNGLEENLAFFDNWIREVKRALKPNGTLWISGTYHSIYLCGYLLDVHGYRILNDISWFKPNAAPNIGCRSFTASHETLLWASKHKKAKHTFNYKDMKYNKWEEDVFKKEDKQMRSVWSILGPGPSEKMHGRHPTQKPLKLLERVVLASSHAGDVVLDPFAGSSTTGIAASLLGRRFVGIDSEEDYLSLSAQRYRKRLDLQVSRAPENLASQVVVD